MSWFSKLKASVFAITPTHEVAGSGRRAQAWNTGNPGAISAMLAIGEALRSKSRDLVRRNAWANAGVEAFVSNAIGTGIKPQSMAVNESFKTQIQVLWTQWTEEADVTGQTDFYGLQSLACRAMAEGGECFIRLLPQPPDSGLSVPLQLQILESEHVPYAKTEDMPNGNRIRSGIEFDRTGKRIAYHVFTTHPQDGGNEIVRIEAQEILHIYRVLRPGQIRGEPWLARALVRLNELDAYDDAELVRKKTAAMFTAFITRNAPEDKLMGEGAADAQGIAQGGLEPGTMQILEPGEDIKFSDPADVGATYAEFLRTQLRAVASAIGVTYEQLSGDLTGVNYSSIRAGMLEFRRRMEAFQHGVIVHQMCRPIWNAWVKQAILSGAIFAPSYIDNPRPYQVCKWIPQGWSWVDPEKEIKALQLAIRSGFMSRTEAVSSFGYDAIDVEREIATENARSDKHGLVFDSDARNDVPTPQEITAPLPPDITTTPL